MTKKQYKLMHDLPDLRAGAIFESIKGGRYYQSSGGQRYKAEEVERNRFFFEEIKEQPIRNEVHSIAAAEKEINDHIHSYYFFTSQKIDKEKLPIVKKTIENCINGEDDLKLFRGIEDTIRPFEKAYTKSQLEEAERKIWDAARQPLPYHQFTFRYQTFDDYKKQNP
jgi:hypothetical protein